MKVPSTALESWRSANKAKAEQDKLMLAYSPSMSFACVTNTHFTHAMKLGGGDRTLFSDGRTVLKFAETSEWKAIRDEGILAAVYDEALWADKDALVSLMLGDNLNAAVQIGEDEVQAFGRVDVIVTELAHSQHSNPLQISIRIVHDIIEKEGFGKFDSKTFMDFIKLRLTLSHKAAKIFHTCQQHTVGFRVHVKVLITSWYLSWTTAAR